MPWHVSHLTGLRAEDGSSGDGTCNERLGMLRQIERQC